MEFTYEVTSRFLEAEREALFQPLLAFNRAVAGDPNYLPLNVLLHSDKKVIGGLWGHTAAGWMVIELMYLPESLRGIGVGSSTVRKAEREAIARGCEHAWLDTHEFQAKGFYESLGYECFGELPDYPEGYARFFMRKDF